MSGAEADTELQARVKAFRQTLEQYGWSEGRNIHIDIRFSAIRSDEYQALAKEMVALQPDVIFGHTTPVVVALQRESRTVPIVFVNVSDPLGSGKSVLRRIASGIHSHHDRRYTASLRPAICPA